MPIKMSYWHIIFFHPFNYICREKLIFSDVFLQNFHYIRQYSNRDNYLFKEMIEKETLELLKNQTWQDILLKLETHASIKAYKLRWRTPNKSLPKGFQVIDLVHDAIKKVYTGERKWNPEKDSDIINYLKSVIDSDINHLVESFNHRKLNSTKQLKNGENDYFESLTSNTNQLEEIIAEELKEQVLKCAENNDKSEQVALGLVECMKPREIVETTGISIEEVYAYIRKIKKCLTQTMSKNI